ncbi:MAG: tetratricopeptide (TPR) repeat protein [Planctomycetota bacterium]|jgi:tetratricopeptide (TPR) repeat protein
MTIHVSQGLRQVLDDLGHEFLREFLEIETSRNPDNVEALAELGHIYTLQGQWNKGLTVDLQLVAVVPESSTVRYNLACSYALLGRIDEAFDALNTAVDLGYDEDLFMAEDSDLEALRNDQRFRTLLERIRSLKELS